MQSKKLPITKKMNVSLNIRSNITPEKKCGYCTQSKCCTYFTQQIPGPRSKRDFDHLLWQISHQNAQIYKDEEGWFLLLNNKCNHLLADGRCNIYHSRPLVCREHSNNYCEFDAPAEDGFELYFENYNALLNYCRKRFKHWEQRFGKPTKMN